MITPSAMKPRTGAAGMLVAAMRATPRILPRPDDHRAQFDPGRRRRAERRRLSAGGVDRARLVPGHAARKTGPGRGPGGRRQDPAGPGAVAPPGPHAGAPSELRV